MRRAAYLIGALLLASCSPPQAVTFDEFKRIEIGMTKAQVDMITEAHGELRSTTGASSGYDLTSYRWLNPDGSSMTVTFVDDRADRITQSGLR